MLVGTNTASVSSLHESNKWYIGRINISVALMIMWGNSGFYLLKIIVFETSVEAVSVNVIY